MSTFCAHIPYIVNIRTEEQVAGVYAGWVVTSVKYIKPVRDRPIMDFPRNSVCQLRLTLHSDPAVSGFVPTSDPNPTPGGSHAVLNVKTLSNLPGRRRPAGVNS